jgi:type I restriction enzyme S subunit
MSSAPEGWLAVPLGQVGVWRTGSTPAKSHPAYWLNGSTPWVSPKDIKQAYIETVADKVTQRAINDTGLQTVPPGSILFVTRSGILARIFPMAVTTVPVVVNQDIKALTPATDVDPLFLYHQLSFRAGNILRTTVKLGTTVQSVDFRALKQVEITLPPLAEQRAIAARISTIGASLEGIRAQVKDVLRLLDAYERAALLQALLARPPEIGSRTQPPDAPLVLLGDIAEIQGGLALGKRHRTAELVSRPYLRVANVQRGRLELDDIKEVLVTLAEADRYRLEPGDILMNEGGDRDKLGRGWVWKGEIPDCLHQNHVFRVRLKDKAFPTEFVSHYANEIGREYFLTHAKQTTNLASISKSKLGRLPIRLPSAERARAALTALEEQRRWVATLRSQAQTIIAATDAAQRAVYRKAFEGRLVPRAVTQPLPVLTLPKNVPQSVPAARVNRSRDLKGPTMKDLADLLKQWPREGMTFEGLRERVPSDYETLKDAVFELLAGAEAKLEQRYDPEHKSMRFFRSVE